MKTINFRNIFGVAAVSSASLAVILSIFLLFTMGSGIKPADTFLTVYTLSAFSVFSVAGFCSSLVKERYPFISVIGMASSTIAFLFAFWLVYQQFGLFQNWGAPEETTYYRGGNPYKNAEFLGKFMFFFASTSFIAGYISLLLTTLRSYSCVLNKFIYFTISLLCLIWSISQITVLVSPSIVINMYQFVLSVYLLSLLGGVWVFVLSRMGVAEPKKGQDEMFKEV